MSVSDPLADMLNRIRNAHLAKQDVAEIPHSGLKTEVARILKAEGFIADYVTEGGTKKVIRLFLKYHGDREATIRGMRRVSRPGLRQYVGSDKIPRVLGGMGIAILSTSAGVLTDREARERRIGGEVLCHVW